MLLCGTSGCGKSTLSALLVSLHREKVVSFEKYKYAALIITYFEVMYVGNKVESA